MKKQYSFAIGVAIALSFLGVQFVLPIFQIVPVTEAQPTLVPVIGAVVSQPLAAAETEVTAVAPTAFPTLAPVAESIRQVPTAIPTLAPIATEPAVVDAPVSPTVVVHEPAQAPTHTTEQALLDTFIQAVSGKEASQVTGVAVPGRFSLPVIQQPSGETSFVSTEDDVITQFGSASAYGTIGLLAHNYLSGQAYFDLREGDDVVVIYGDGRQSQYRVTQIRRYQALSPTSVYSDFIDVSDASQTKLSAGQLFQRMYTTANRLVFQTCIEANGDSSWGRLFVIAEKVSP